MRKGIVLSVIFFTFSFLGVFAYSSPGMAHGHVNDFANVLSVETRQSLEQELSSFTASTTHEIAVVTVPTIGSDETIETYAVKLFEEWKIGKKGTDNGILFLVAVANHKARIEVGYGLEGVLPDMVANNILEQEVLPKFKNTDYNGGIVSGTRAIMRVVKNEPGSKDVYSGKKMTVTNINGNVIEIIFFFLFLVGGIILNVLASSNRWWPGGLAGLIIGGLVGVFIGKLFFGSILVGGAVLGGVLGVIGLLIDFFASKHGPFKGGGSGPFIVGSGGRFSSGGGSSFGGFGGGRSGGGGASGSW